MPSPAQWDDNSSTWKVILDGNYQFTDGSRLAQIYTIFISFNIRIYSFALSLFTQAMKIMTLEVGQDNSYEFISQAKKICMQIYLFVLIRDYFNVFFEILFLLRKY